MFVSRTKNLVLAGALGLGSLISLASPTLAGPSPAGGGVVVSQPSDPGTGGPGGFTNPTPLPDPEPVDLPIAQPDPQPQPDPGGFTNPTPQPDPQPGDLPIGQPQQDPVVNPELPLDPGDLKDSGGGCPQTHGCPGDQPDPKDCLPQLGTCEVTDKEPAPECNPILASCDVTDREPGSGGGDPGQGDPEVDGDVEVRGQQVDRTALPRTGAGIAGVALAGGALTGLGAGLRKLARRA